MYSDFSDKEFDKSKLITFNGNGKYYDPILTWNETIAPTTIAFILLTLEENIRMMC